MASTSQDEGGRASGHASGVLDLAVRGERLGIRRAGLAVVMSLSERRARKAREKALEGVNLLELAPFRLAEWVEEGGRVVLARPAPSSTGIGRILDRILHTLSTHRIRLDPVGSFAWMNFDGTRTVGEVADLLRSEFGAEIEPAEERLGRLVWMMRGEGFLGYPGYDPGPMD